LDRNFRRALKSAETVSYEECLMLEGRETWWHHTLSKPAGFNGNVILGVAVPMTDQKAKEFRAAEQLAEMSARFDELRLFSTMAAHDARSPLATVSSLIELVLEDFRDMGDGKSDLLRLVSSTVEEALTQISSTLERGRALQRGHNSIRRVDLGRLCGDIATMVDPEMRLAIDLPQGLVECDEVMMQMGVRNLMSNAARFCKQRVAVHVSAEPSGDMLAVEISDDGAGLPAGTKLQDLMLEGQSREGSHGFGLSAIAQLARSRGGSFEIVAGGGVLGGATFRMVLPGRIIGGDHALPTVLDEPAASGVAQTA
jgi:signal transduction histidine kinase